MTVTSTVLSDRQWAEADRLSRYLIGKSCDEKDARDYFEALRFHDSGLTPSQQQLWDMMMRSGTLLRIADGGLALTAPSSPVRKRIFIMFSILETSPQFTDCFLPVDRPRTHILSVGFRAARAVLAGMVGVVLVKVMGCD
jgi:hypothetical protein